MACTSGPSSSSRPDQSSSNLPFPLVEQNWSLRIAYPCFATTSYCMPCQCFQRCGWQGSTCHLVAVRRRSCMYCRCSIYRSLLWCRGRRLSQWRSLRLCRRRGRVLCRTWCCSSSKSRWTTGRSTGSTWCRTGSFQEERPLPGCIHAVSQA